MTRRELIKQSDEFEIIDRFVRVLSLNEHEWNKCIATLASARTLRSFMTLGDLEALFGENARLAFWVISHFGSMAKEMGIRCLSLDSYKTTQQKSNHKE